MCRMAGWSGVIVLVHPTLVAIAAWFDLKLVPSPYIGPVILATMRRAPGAGDR